MGQKVPKVLETGGHKQMKPSKYYMRKPVVLFTQRFAKLQNIHPNLIFKKKTAATGGGSNGGGVWGSSRESSFPQQTATKT